MKGVVLAVGVACGLAGCVTPSVDEQVAEARKKFIGQPITERIAALGPPETVIRVGPSRVAYTFAASETRARGGSVSYYRGFGTVEASRSPVSVSTTTCRATFVTKAPTDTTPLYERTIVDVTSSGCR